MKEQYRIAAKRSLTPEIGQISVEAPLIAAKAKAGQFIILRVDEKGERIPLTVADFDREAGTVTIIFQIVGATTEKLSRMKEGDSLQDFVGPLDLILHLLKKNQIAIRDIPLAGILDQFVTWMSARRALDLEVAGEFIAMASHLMLLKTRMVLSEEDRQAQEEMEELIASLEARQRQASFRRVQAVLPWMEGAWQRGNAFWSKGPEAKFTQRVYRYQHRPEELLRALGAWQAKQRKALPPPLEAFQGVVRPEPYRVERKTEELLARLHREGTLRWEDIVRTSESKSEVTAAFLALLELCRRGNIHLDGGMDNPWITPSEGPNPT